MSEILGTLYVLIVGDKRKRTGKTIREKDGKVVSDGNDHSLLYRWTTVEVDAAGEWQVRMRSKRDRFPIIGSPSPAWAKGSKERRLSKPKGDTPATIRDTPCFMLPVDVDRLPFEVEGDPLDGLSVARQVMKYLEIDEDAQGFWHLTSSHMLPGKGVRIRLWIVLDEPMTATQMKALVERLWDGKVDAAIYRPNAEIFTTDPEFGEGVEDPMGDRDRSGPLPGGTKWKPPVEIPDEPKRRPGRPRKAPFDAIKEMLVAKGMYIADAGGGTHHILCINEGDHSGEPHDSDTLYLEAGTDGHANPRLYCHHDHCKAQEDYHAAFMKELGLDRDLSVDDFVFDTLSGAFFMVPIRTPMVEAGVNALLPRVRIGEGEYISAAEWIRRKKLVTSITWAPGRDAILPGEAWTGNGPIYMDGLSSLNTYLPSQHTPPNLDTADLDDIRRKARPWIKHVMRVFRDHWAYIIDVLAFKVQSPGVKVNQCIVFDGVPRIGKDSILIPMIYAVGAHNCDSISPSQLVGRFNKFERSVLCVINETSDSGELNKYKFYEHTKAMFAAPPETRRIDEKNLGEYHIPNVALYVITTNSAKGSLHIPVSDGRYYVASSSIASREEIDHDGYFEKLYRWLYEDGGREAVADYLMTLDVSGFDPKRPPQRTQAWWNVVSASNTEEDVALADALDKLRWPDVITLEELTRRMPGFEVDTRNAMKALVHRLDRLERAYVIAANTDAEDGRWKVGSRKVTYYVRRELTMPDRMKAVKAKIRADKNRREDIE